MAGCPVVGDMVEVLGSEVFFDGVCSSGSGGNSNEDEAAGLDGSEGVGGGEDGGGVGGDDLAEGDSEVLGGSVVWNSEIESEVDRSVQNIQTEVVEVKASIPEVKVVTATHGSFDSELQVGEALLKEHESVTYQHPVQETKDIVEIKANEPVNVSKNAESGGTEETPDQVEFTGTDNLVHMELHPESSHEETGGTG